MYFLLLEPLVGERADDQTADVDRIAIIVIEAVEGLLANRNKDLDVRIDAEQLADRAADAELTDNPDTGILVAVEIARIRLRWVGAVDVALEIFLDRIDKHGHRPPDLAVIRHQRRQIVRAARLLKFAVGVDQPLQRIEWRDRVGRQQQLPHDGRAEISRVQWMEFRAALDDADHQRGRPNLTPERVVDETLHVGLRQARTIGNRRVHQLIVRQAQQIFRIALQQNPLGLQKKGLAVALRGHDDAFIGFVSQKIADGWGFQQYAMGRVQKLLGIVEVAGILDPCIRKAGHRSCLRFLSLPTRVQLQQDGKRRASGMARPALESDSTTIKLFGGER